jgi:hypothetical protein
MDAPDLVISLQVENARLREQVSGLLGQLEERQQLIDAKDRIIELVTSSTTPKKDELAAPTSDGPSNLSRLGIFAALLIFVLWGLVFVPHFLYDQPIDRFGITLAIFATLAGGYTWFLMTHSDIRATKVN